MTGYSVSSGTSAPRPAAARASPSDADNGGGRPEVLTGQRCPIVRGLRGGNGGGAGRENPGRAVGSCASRCARGAWRGQPAVADGRAAPAGAGAGARGFVRGRRVRLKSGRGKSRAKTASGGVPTPLARRARTSLFLLAVEQPEVAVVPAVGDLPAWPRPARTPHPPSWVWVQSGYLHPATNGPNSTNSPSACSGSDVPQGELPHPGGVHHPPAGGQLDEFRRGGGVLALLVDARSPPPPAGPAPTRRRSAGEVLPTPLCPANTLARPRSRSRRKFNPCPVRALVRMVGTPIRQYAPTSGWNSAGSTASALFKHQQRRSARRRRPPRGSGR